MSGISVPVSVARLFAPPTRPPPLPSSQQQRDHSPRDATLRVAGLFAGIGGIERGLHGAQHTTEFLCEVEPTAQQVLRARFGDDIPLAEDIREVDCLPDVELVAAGFPCQDLSQAGRTAGIAGDRSGLVDQVFRLIRNMDSLRWLLLENVPFMLQLAKGEAMRFLTRSLDELGFRWAYRVVDARAFGLPQRRQRVLLLASRDHDPRDVLLSEDAGEPPAEDRDGVACGFYWTEGIRGLGWAVNAAPTLKGGSTIGIPSPPAIWMPDGTFVLPDIRDGERLQGFPADWTEPAGGKAKGPRWKLVGNAVNVPVSRWLGQRLREPTSYDSSRDEPLSPTSRWPTAAWGEDGRAYKADVSMWPRHEPRQSLAEFLRFPARQLSERATAGFLGRTRRSQLRFPEGFIADLERHLDRVSSSAPLSATPVAA
jgi:DNA (cytosine-5)-methyltransferase 1